MAKDNCDLSFEEIMRARYAFTQIGEVARDLNELRQALGQLGQFPEGEELQHVLEHFGASGVTFEGFCNYLRYLKAKFFRPEPKDVDTLRAFVAMGGDPDKGGYVNADMIREMCKLFQLTIDIEAMLKEVDEDASGCIEFEEFKDLWNEATKGESGASDAPAEEKLDQETIKAQAAEAAKEELKILQSFLSPGLFERKPTLMDLGKRKQTKKSIYRLPPISGTTAVKEESAPREEQQATAEQQSTQKVRNQSLINGVVYAPDPYVIGSHGFKKAKLASSTTKLQPLSARGQSKNSTFGASGSTSAQTPRGNSSQRPNDSAKLE